MMGFRVCVLGSGSSGNATYISSGSTRLLIDAGLSAREITRRMGEIDADPGDLDGVCISHEHRDHVNALPMLHKKYGPVVYSNAGTREALSWDERFGGVSWKIFVNGSGFYVGDFYVEPFSVPHDAYDPVAFMVTHEGVTVGVVTDVGMATTSMRERLKGCDVLVLESNYDEQLLVDSRRPWYLKQRIMGRQGHLSNVQAAELLGEVAGSRLKKVFLTHLSSECNSVDRALEVVRGGLRDAGHGAVDVAMTYPDRVSEVWPAEVEVVLGEGEQGCFGF